MEGDPAASDSTLVASEAEDSDLCRSSASEEDLLRASDEEEGLGSSQPSRPYPARRLRPGSSTFDGKPVCLRVFRMLLGIGETTLQRLRQRDEIYTNRSRQPLPKHPSFGFTIRGEGASKWMGVVMFFWYVYHSSAEHMPDNFRAVTKESAFRAVADSTDADSELRAISSFMQTLQSRSADVDVHTIGPGTFAGERRFLPFGTRSEMFYEYRAFCSANNEEPASYTTFMRIAKAVIGPAQKNGHLKFRKVNEHAKCDDCVRLKKALKVKIRAGESRSEQQKEYMRHILSQWLDRQLYWQFRSMSQTFFRQQMFVGDRTDQSLVCVIPRSAMLAAPNSA